LLNDSSFFFGFHLIIQSHLHPSLFTASLQIDYPMLFELRNASTDSFSHCGVLEFIAEEGVIYIPYWVTNSSLFLSPIQDTRYLVT